MLDDSTYSTPGAKKVIIFLSDGEYNLSGGVDYWDKQELQNYANTLKENTEIYTIGFANEGEGTETLRGLASYKPGSNSEKLFISRTTMMNLSRTLKRFLLE